MVLPGVGFCEEVIMDIEREYDKRHGIIRAMWAKDSETSEDCLIDLDTHQVIAKRWNGKIIDPSEKVKPV